ncbi:putative F-box protein At1g32420 [Solanum dulcamara]|uniref:putative F-box protein At1g32420 n=2 Tax=Solanum dulcamara TaxID=45834 RepID=UPI002485B1A6|nr:putative F-box protein At1g32420 [Solanum dulcamara]
MKKQRVNISIPKEVVVEILRRVPCQDLCETLKKVCMQWCSIIYSGSFAYSHVERGILKSSSSFSQLEAVLIDKTYDTRSVTVSALEWHSSFPNYPHQEHEEEWEITYMYRLYYELNHITHMMTVNSVNGLVCFWSSNARVYVFNPMTKEYFATSPYTYEISFLSPCIAAVGFGFCQLSYEYKVIVFRDDSAGLMEYGEMKPLVFTVGIDRSWRSLNKIPDRKFLSRIEKGTHVKGVLYWYTLQDSKRIKSLLCFDVSKEEVFTTMVPAELNSLEEGGRSITRIAEKGGNLCLINISYGPIYSLLIKVYIAHTSTDLSSLNSWKKEFNVTVPNMAYQINMTWWFISIFTDDMLVIDIKGESEIVIDVATGMLLSELPRYGSGIVIHYVPSLVSLYNRPPLLNS